MNRADRRTAAFAIGAVRLNGHAGAAIIIALGHYQIPLGLIERAHRLLCWATHQYRL